MTPWPLALKLGIGLLIVGTAPLLLFILADEAGLISDPNPNPIGLGLLFFFSVWPALILIAVGLVKLLLGARR